MEYFQKKHEEPAGVNLSLIITPMLDMAFQLMAFFIMTYHPSSLEGHIDGTLLPPAEIKEVGNAGGNPKDEKPSVENEPNIKEDYMLIVKAVETGKDEGKPSRIFLKPPVG